MKALKKSIPICLLALALIISIVLVAPHSRAASTDALSYSISNGKVTITDCNESISGELIIPDTIDGYPVTTIGYEAFRDCSSLQSVTIPDSVTTIGDYAFDYCSSLTSITIPNSVTSIGDWAFSWCACLQIVTIGNSVATIGDAAFYQCTSLQSIVIPGSVTAIGGSAFSGCANLSGIWVEASNPNYCSDDSGVLYNKDMTTLIDAPSNVATHYTIPDNVVTIGVGAFDWRTSLQSIVIPDSVTTIGDSAFVWCSNLRSVTIGNSVVAIGRGAFSFCDRLQNIYYAGTQTQWDSISVGDNNTELSNAVIHFNHIHTFVDGVCVCGADSIQIAPSTPIGDMTGDNEVNNEDVVLLLWHTLFPEEYPLSFNADLTGDGNADNEDVVLLLWHTLFPEDYPL